MNMCSTGPGRAPTPSMACATTPSNCAPCRFRRFLARACWHGDTASRAAFGARRWRPSRIGVSGCHVLFTQQADCGGIVDAGFALRLGVQFHWFNQGWLDFAAFLAALRQDKRKKSARSAIRWRALA